MNQPSRHRSRWALDFTKPPSGRGSGASELPSPPGFSSSFQGLHAESSRSTDTSLRLKRSWDIALAPIKQVPMNLFLMYMAGNTISIFPIMMVIMMVVRSFKTLFSVNATFKSLDASLDGSGASNILQKIVFILGNLANVALAMYKSHSMGLLPTHASDWLAFADPIKRMEWSYVSV